MDPLVSVIIPTFRSAKYFEESLSSIVHQTYSNLEILIIDDTPEDDGTKAIIESFHDNRIIYMKPEERLGMVKSLNYGISIAKGEYIARMDADDISHRRRIEKQILFMMSHQDVGVVGCGAYTISSDGLVNGVRIPPESNIDIKMKTCFNAAFIHPSILMRKDIIMRNMYNENCHCCEDYELWSRLLPITQFHNLPYKLLKYRLLDDSAMSQQLSILSDESAYTQHMEILSLIYYNIKDYLESSIDKKYENWKDLLFSKRIDHVPMKEKEQFLYDYAKDIVQKMGRTDYSRECFAYQWLKMSKTRFFLARNKKLILDAFCVAMSYLLNNIIARAYGLVWVNRHTFDW